MDSETLKDFTTFISDVEDEKRAAGTQTPNQEKKAKSSKSDLLWAIAYLAAVEVYKEADMIAMFKSKKAMTEVLNLLFDHLLNFNSFDNPETRLWWYYELALACVKRREDKLAGELMKIVYEKARQKEDFRLIDKLWDLEEMMYEKPDFRPDTASIAIRRKINYYEYYDLWMSLEEIQKNTDIRERRPKLEELRNHHLLIDPARAKTKRAEHLYWKIKSACSIQLTDYETAIPLQRELIQLIQDFPWVELLHLEHGMAKEMGILYQILIRANCNVEAKEVIDELNAMPLTIPIAIQERDRVKYPFALSYAMAYGNTEEAQEAYHSFIEQLDNGELQLHSSYIAENLYVCGYFCIASQDFEAAAQILTRLQKFGKEDAAPKYLALNQFLKMIYEIECSHWEDAQQTLKIAKKPLLEAFPILNDLLIYIGRTIRQWTKASNPDGHQPFTAMPENWMNTLQGQDILNYFDIIAWMKSRKEGLTMMEIFRLRVSSSSNDHNP